MQYEVRAGVDPALGGRVTIGFVESKFSRTPGCSLVEEFQFSSCDASE